MLWNASCHAVHSTNIVHQQSDLVQVLQYLFHSFPAPLLSLLNALSHWLNPGLALDQLHFPTSPYSSQHEIMSQSVDQSSRNGGSKQAVVCVFCGASPGTSPGPLAAARALAQAFHKHNIKLVYGGGTTGIMGELARTLVSLSGPDSVHGVIPRSLLAMERNYDPNRDPREAISETEYGRTTIVEDMHTRKQRFASDVSAGGPGSGFVALPGGYGTMEELMEMVTWNQLGIHAQPIVVFDVEGYWDFLFQWRDHAVKAGFISAGNKDIMVKVEDAEGAVKALVRYQQAEGRFKLDWETRNSENGGLKFV
nr:log family protein [Quercus suber]